MKNTVARRQYILEILCQRKSEKLENLANELGVTSRTIRFDIEILSCTYPIYTLTGPYGGVFIAPNYVFGMKYLTKEQEQFLESILHNYSDKEKEILEEILATFKMPEIKNGTK